MPTGQAGLAAIDSGTTLIGGPTSAVNSLFDQIPGSMNLSTFGAQFAGMFSIRAYLTSTYLSQKQELIFHSPHLVISMLGQPITHDLLRVQDVAYFSDGFQVDAD